jgi:hypothetical protein
MHPTRALIADASFRRGAAAALKEPRVTRARHRARSACFEISRPPRQFVHRAFRLVQPAVREIRNGNTTRSRGELAPPSSLARSRASADRGRSAHPLEGFSAAGPHPSARPPPEPLPTDDPGRSRPSGTARPLQPSRVPLAALGSVVGRCRLLGRVRDHRQNGEPLARQTHTELANAEQLRLLISLHRQQGMPLDAGELAGLTKWQAAERINQLRGRPAPSRRELDADLLAVLQQRFTDREDAS